MDQGHECWDSRRGHCGRGRENTFDDESSPAKEFPLDGPKVKNGALTC